jgi:hypothetical protein
MKQITKSSTALSRKNIINRIADVPGGISLTVADLTAGKIVIEGCPLTAPSSGKRTVCKQAVLLTGSTTTVFRVESSTNQFKTGDIIFQQVGGAAYAGTVVTEVGTVGGVLYDTITVGTALESATVGTFIYQSSVSAGEGADTGALENAADVIIKEALEVPSDTQVILIKDAYQRADVVENCIGPLYLASLDVNEIKY